MNAQKRIERMKRYVIRTTPDTFYWELPWFPNATTNAEYDAYMEALRVWQTRMGQKHFDKNTQIEMRQDFDLDRNCVVTGKVVFLKPMTRAERALEFSEKIQEGTIAANAARRKTLLLKELGYYEFL